MADPHLKSRIHQWVEENSEQIFLLTEDLIHFPSVNRLTTGDERECQRYLADRLQTMGLEVDVFEPTEVPGLLDHKAYWPGRSYQDRPNVVGRLRGSGKGRSLLFSSHVDVVEGCEGGRFPAFNPVREAGKLYGRGSSDMKGGLAATIMAIRCLQDLGVCLLGDVIVESVVDEENGGSNGTLACRLKGFEADAAICPEPNGMAISTAHRGGCVWEIRVQGSSGMPFGAETLINPAYAVSHLTVAIEAWEKARNERIVAPALYRGSPGLPVVVSAVESVHPVAGVPARGRIEVWVEVYPGTTFEELQDDFIANLERVVAETPVLKGCKTEMSQKIRFLPGSEIASNHPIVTLLQQTTSEVLAKPAEIRGAPFACDVFVFNLHSSTPCLILGPRGANAHAPDEWVEMEDLLRLTEVYALTAVNWCGIG